MEITIKINGQAVSVEVSHEVMSAFAKVTTKQKIYPTKSVDIGICESLTSTLSPLNAATYISQLPKKSYATGKPCAS